MTGAGPVQTLLTGAVTRQALGRLQVETHGPGFTDLTAVIARWVQGTGIREGLLTTFCRHTSASLTIQENADPSVRTDLMTALDRLAPRDAGYVHRKKVRTTCRRISGRCSRAPPSASRSMKAGLCSAPGRVST